MNNDLNKNKWRVVVRGETEIIKENITKEEAEELVERLNKLEEKFFSKRKYYDITLMRIFEY